MPSYDGVIYLYARELGVPASFVTAIERTLTERKCQNNARCFEEILPGFDFVFTEDLSIAQGVSDWVEEYFCTKSKICANKFGLSKIDVPVFQERRYLFFKRK